MPQIGPTNYEKARHRIYRAPAVPFVHVTCSKDHALGTPWVSPSQMLASPARPPHSMHRQEVVTVRRWPRHGSNGGMIVGESSGGSRPWGTDRCRRRAVMVTIEMFNLGNFFLQFDFRAEVADDQVQFGLSW